MPFGLFFAALFFGLLCSFAGLGRLGEPDWPSRIGGALLVVLGVSLALGLLRRRIWARWTGAVVALALAGVALQWIAAAGGVQDHVLLLGAVATVVLLVVPATGDPGRATDKPPTRGLGPAGWLALASLAGLATLAVVSDDRTGRSTETDGALPVSAIGKRLRWIPFDQALPLARSEGKPILATFVTDWCPYCTKMTRKTWRSAAVIERSADVIPVRIDAETGPDGPELAARYGVRGFPAQVLIDADGNVISRYDGYQDARALLAWLDSAGVGAGPATVAGSGS